MRDRPPPAAPDQVAFDSAAPAGARDLDRLIDACRRAEPAAVERLWARVGHRLTPMVARLGGQPEDASGLAKSLMREAVRSVSETLPAGREAADWLFSEVRRLALGGGPALSAYGPATYRPEFSPRERGGARTPHPVTAGGTLRPPAGARSSPAQRHLPAPTPLANPAHEPRSGPFGPIILAGVMVGVVGFGSAFVWMNLARSDPAADLGQTAAEAFLSASADEEPLGSSSVPAAAIPRPAAPRQAPGGAGVEPQPSMPASPEPVASMPAPVLVVLESPEPVTLLAAPHAVATPRPPPPDDPPRPLASGALLGPESPPPGVDDRNADRLSSADDPAAPRRPRAVAEPPPAPPAILDRQPPRADDRMAGSPPATGGVELASRQLVPDLAPPKPPAPEPAREPVASFDPSASAPARVFIHYTGHNDRRRAAAEELAATLTSAGFEIVDLRAVRGQITQGSVRYFRATDDEIGRGLLRAVDESVPGASWRLVDFTAYPRPPRPGTLEIWLPSQITAAAG